MHNFANSSNRTKLASVFVFDVFFVLPLKFNKLSNISRSYNVWQNMMNAERFDVI